MATMALSGACLLKAGSNVNSKFTGATAETDWNVLINQAESFVNVATRKNWTDVYSTLDSDVKLILESAVSDLAAIYAITYDMSGYASRGEAESMITILRDAAVRAISILRDVKSKEFIG